MVKATTACLTLYRYDSQSIGSALAQTLECLEYTLIDLRLELVGTITELLLLDAGLSYDLL